jgi:hypothetical protein
MRPRAMYLPQMVERHEILRNGNLAVPFEYATSDNIFLSPYLYQVVPGRETRPLMSRFFVYLFLNLTFPSPLPPHYFNSARGVALCNKSCLISLMCCQCVFTSSIRSVVARQKPEVQQTSLNVLQTSLLTQRNAIHMAAVLQFGCFIVSLCITETNSGLISPYSSVSLSTRPLDLRA